MQSIHQATSERFQPLPDTVGAVVQHASGPGPCGICGSQNVHTDEVSGRSDLWLAECTRCRHRWTRPLEATRRWERRAASPRSVRAGTAAVSSAA